MQDVRNYQHQMLPISKVKHHEKNLKITLCIICQNTTKTNKMLDELLERS